MYSELYGKLTSVLGRESVYRNECLSKHTTFKIGGPAPILICPKTIEELTASLSEIKKAGVNAYIIGLGSNLLFSDEGIDAVVVKLAENFSSVELIDGNRIQSLSGTSLKELSYFAMEHSLTGLEFASGIPGSVGGAVFMNAGAYIGEMKDVVEVVEVLDENLNVIQIRGKDMAFGYRSSLIQQKGYIVLSTILKLESGNQSEVLEVMKDLEQRREDKQPLDMPSAGSVFKRPEGYYAGKLIQDAGLRGIRYRGAMVSDKHAGFIVNTGGAKASDVMTLVDIVRKTVFDKFGVLLEPEIRLIGK